VAEIVDGVTKISDIFKSHDLTQAESYRKMLLSMVNDIRVMLVKFGDRLHNMRTLEYLPLEKQRRLAKETLDIYAPFAHRFGLANIKWELEDLSFKHLHREAYDQIARDLKSRRREREHYIRKFSVPIEKRLREQGFKFEISGRPKHIYSIYNKMIKRNKPLKRSTTSLPSLSWTRGPQRLLRGVRHAGHLHPNPERFRTISPSRRNGYQSSATWLGPKERW
jgi:(p)ppGpp synthase/HD superfamily hydrolase